MPQHFIKIEIKGDQRNLPEKSGEYEVLFNGDFYGTAKFDKTDSIASQGVIWWINKIKVYWLPVPEPQQPEQPESAELSTRSYPSICSHCEGKGYIQPIQGQITTTAWSNVCPVCNGSKVIIITETFASQSPSKAVISDELNEKQKYLIEITAMLLGACILTKDEIISELTKHAKLILENASQSYEAVIMPTDQDVEKECKKRYVGNLAPTYFKECAKWFRSQVREVELRATLRNFLQDLEKRGILSLASADIVVDDYLKSPENK